MAKIFPELRTIILNIIVFTDSFIYHFRSLSCFPQLKHVTFLGSKLSRFFSFENKKSSQKTSRRSILVFLSMIVQSTFTSLTFHCQFNTRHVLFRAMLYQAVLFKDCSLPPQLGFICTSDMSHMVFIVVQKEN